MPPTTRPVGVTVPRRRVKKLAVRILHEYRVFVKKLILNSDSKLLHQTGGALIKYGVVGKRYYVAVFFGGI